MIDNIIKMILVISVVVWISFSIYIIVPKLTGLQLVSGLTLIIGVLGTIFAWMESLKVSKSKAEKDYALRCLELEVKTYSVDENQ